MNSWMRPGLRISWSYRGDVALVVDFDQYVSIAVAHHPVDGVVDGFLHGFLVLHTLVLSEVENAEDDDHAEIVRLVEDALQAAHVFAAEDDPSAAIALLFQGCSLE